MIIKYTYYYKLYIQCSNLIKILWNKWNRVCIYNNENEKTIKLKKSFCFGMGLSRGGSRRGNGSTSLWSVVEFLKDERPHRRWNNSLAM